MLQSHPDADWIISLDQVQSTMPEAESMLDKLQSIPDKVLIVAREQLSGRGRDTKQWISPSGGLWFTYLLKTDNNNPQITLLLGLCLLQSIVKHFPCLESDLSIKWPNDLLLRGNKLAGILVKKHKQYLCIGIGINTNVLDFAGILPAPASLEKELSFPISNSALLSTFLTDFNRKYKDYCKTGARNYINAINSLLFGNNTHIVFEKGLQTVDGICRGVSEDGALLLED